MLDHGPSQTETKKNPSEELRGKQEEIELRMTFLDDTLRVNVYS
jgi:hypothetical protein